MTKPDWWPKNPYPIDIFPMTRVEYSEVVPSPTKRTALSGMLGREFWEIASESIYDALRSNIAEIIEPFDVPEKEAIKQALGISKDA